MLHFNLSSEWEVRTTNSNRHVFSPIPTDDREYNPQTDIAIHGSVRPVNNNGLSLSLNKYAQVPDFDGGAFLQKKAVSDESHTLLDSFPSERFAIVFSSKYPVKIRGREDKTQRALVTLSLTETSVTYKDDNVLVDFVYNGKHHFAIILEEGEEVNFFDFGHETPVKRMCAYVFRKGCLKEYIIEN